MYVYSTQHTQHLCKLPLYTKQTCINKYVACMAIQNLYKKKKKHTYNKQGRCGRRAMCLLARTLKTIPTTELFSLLIHLMISPFNDDLNFS